MAVVVSGHGEWDEEARPGQRPGQRFEPRRSRAATSLQPLADHRHFGSPDADRPSSPDGADEGPPPSGPRPLQGDEAELFRSFNPHLVRIVQSRAITSRETVDDACSFAWATFMRVQPDRARNWRSWLVTTATHEAWKLSQVDTRDAQLLWEVSDDPVLADSVADQHDRVAIRAGLREALEALSKVPERRRRAKALSITGFTYEEIARKLGLSHTRVNQLLTEANRVLREEQGRAAIAAEPSRRPQRAVRLDQLERDTPKWLSAAIGPRPGKTANGRALLAWRRAALVIDDYRREFGAGLGNTPLGERPATPEAARAFDLAAAAVRRVLESRGHDRRTEIVR
jgi:RNA polymerase sigma factor (sigma-70 family)